MACLKQNFETNFWLANCKQPLINHKIVNFWKNWVMLLVINRVCLDEKQEKFKSRATFVNFCKENQFLDKHLISKISPAILEISQYT